MFDHKSFATEGLYPGLVTHSSVSNLGSFEFQIDLIELGSNYTIVSTGDLTHSSLLQRAINSVFGFSEVGSVTSTVDTNDVSVNFGGVSSRGYVNGLEPSGGTIEELVYLGGSGGFSYQPLSVGPTKYKIRIRVTRKGKTWEYEQIVGLTTAKIVAKVINKKVAEPTVSVVNTSMVENKDPVIKVKIK